MLNMELTIFLIIVVGYIVSKAGFFSQKTRSDMTNIVIYVILPCNIFASFHKGLTPDTIRQCIVVLIASFGLQFFYIILNKFLYIKFTPERRIVLQYGTMVNNASFIGLPVISSVFGPTGVLYGSIILIPIRIFMWTIGLSLYSKSDNRQMVKQIATHPCIWAVILGFIYAFTPIELPVFLSGTITTVGNCITTLTMLIVGSILSDVNPRNLLDKGCFYYSFFRLIAIPAVVFCVMTLLKADTLTTGVVVLSSAMPAATTTAILAEKYGKDSEFASKTVFTSTILSMVTLPLIAEILTRLL